MKEYVQSEIAAFEEKGDYLHKVYPGIFFAKIQGIKRWWG